MIIDAYTHCGMFKYKPIQDVQAVMKKAQVDKAVLVQHLAEYDNSYIGDIVSKRPGHFAGVFQVDSESQQAISDLRQLADSGVFKGIRFTIETLQTRKDLWEAAVDLNLIIVLYAPDGMRYHIEGLNTFLEANPSSKIVITHLGNPDIYESSDLKLYREVLTLSNHNGVYFQISGLKMFCPYPHMAFRPLIEEAFDTFDNSRIVWGSNYPVIGTHDDYTKDIELYIKNIIPIPESCINGFLGDNSNSLWFSGEN